MSYNRLRTGYGSIIWAFEERVVSTRWEYPFNRYYWGENSNRIFVELELVMDLTQPRGRVILISEPLGQSVEAVIPLIPENAETRYQDRREVGERSTAVGRMREDMRRPRFRRGFGPCKEMDAWMLCPSLRLSIRIQPQGFRSS